MALSKKSWSLLLSGLLTVILVSSLISLDSKSLELEEFQTQRDILATNPIDLNFDNVRFCGQPGTVSILQNYQCNWIAYAAVLNYKRLF